MRGIAACIQPGEIDGFVDALREAGSIGGGLYDFATVSRRADRDAVWGSLARLNE